jgi:DGQHR domain-containing protein
MEDAAQLEGIFARNDLESIYNRKSTRYVYKKVVKQDLEPFFKEGWEKTGYKSKEHFRLKKVKDIGTAFEDELWCTFYRMGFEVMNKDSKFKILRHSTNIEKQVDVFAKDGNCICLVECKAANEPHTKKSLGKDIDQIAAIRHDIEQSIYQFYKNSDGGAKLKIIWILALQNIDINDNDSERAQKANIKIISSSMINYYLELSNHFGRSAKYQFLADMLPNKEIPHLIDPLPAMRGKMGGTTFYSFIIEPDKLLKLSYIAHRSKTDEESFRTYQRMANKNRLKEIAEYIQKKDGIFPTSIVININTNNRPLRFDLFPQTHRENISLGTLYLPNRYKTAWIIDGQHRLFAYSDLEEAKTATLPVIAFEDLEPDKQAQLFVDINGEQLKVSKNLLNDLYANLHWNSDDPREKLLALTSRLVKELNGDINSPFRDRINFGGKKHKSETLTLTALAAELKKSQLLGHVKSSKAKEITPGYLFDYDLDSSLIRSKEIICGYYSLFLANDKLKKQWEYGSNEGGYICTNQGIITTLRLLKAILDHVAYKDNIDVTTRKPNRLLTDIEKYVMPVIDYLSKASPQIIREFKGNYGEGGYKTSSYALYKIVHDAYSPFEPPNLKEYISKVDTSNNVEAYNQLHEIETKIQQHVVNTLKQEYGDDYSKWWHEGVKEQIRAKAMSTASQHGEYSRYEKYLYLIDLKEIISDNWELFGETYTLNARNSDSKKNRLDWYNKLNDIRNIVDHPPRGGVSEEQLQFVIDIHTQLNQKLHGFSNH